MKTADESTRIDGAAPAAPWRKVWAGGALLVVAVSAIYANSFHGTFAFDDLPSIGTNRAEAGPRGGLPQPRPRAFPIQGP